MMSQIDEQESPKFDLSWRIYSQDELAECLAGASKFGKG